MNPVFDFKKGVRQPSTKTTLRDAAFEGAVAAFDFDLSLAAPEGEEAFLAIRFSESV